MSFGEQYPLVLDKTADGVVSATPAVFYGAKLTSDGTNAAIAIIYDNASAASGAIIGTLACVIGAADELFFPDGLGVQCKNGIYVDVTTPGHLTLYYSA